MAKRFIPRLTLLLATLLSSSACTTVVTLSRPTVQVDTSAGWTASADGIISTQQDLSRWWGRLNDSTLTDLIERTLARNTDLRAGRARLRQARAQRDVAAADLRPTVSSSAAASDRSGTPSAFSAGFDATWEPDVFGVTRSGVDAAAADARATAADLNATRVSLVAEVARNYIGLRSFQVRLQIAQRNEAAQAETLELTQFRVQAGLASSVDAEQARSNLEQTRAQLPTLELSITQTIHRLSTLAGLEPQALAPQLIEARALPNAPDQVAVGIPAETLRQRPDVQAAEQRIAAESYRVSQASRRQYPQFSLSGSLGTEIVTGALSGGTSLVTSLAASVVKTVFDSGRIRQQIEIQSAAQELAVASYDSTVLLALEDVENAIVSFEFSRQRLVSLRAAADAAGSAALLAQTQYQTGLADFQQVLDTQRTVLTVQDAIATTESDRLIALVQLYKALGGGWDNDATPHSEKTP